MAFTKRRVETLVIKRIGPDEGVLYENSIGHGFFPEMAGLKPGDRVDLETRGLSQITGVRVGGVWLFRKSDEDLEREHREWAATWEQDKLDLLTQMRPEWQARTIALPDWIRARMKNLAAGPRFEVDGWGYELCVAELAAIYAEHPDRDAPEAMAYAEREGTSGNQHAMAWALAQVHLTGDDEAVARSVSALTPLTGDPFYRGDGAAS